MRIDGRTDLTKVTVALRNFAKSDCEKQLEQLLGEVIFIIGSHHHHHHHHHVQEGLGLIPVPCILKMKLVPPSVPQSSYVPSSFWFIF